jgi:peptidoglycan/LPS O-acetylase OafA/YrhL
MKESANRIVDSAAASSGPAWIRPFQRVTSRGEHVREIDGLRFLAISAVYLLHLNHYVGFNAPQIPSVQSSLMSRILEHGAFGVQLFFAISGFILALPFARHHLAGAKKITLRAYYLRRLTRLEPPLIVNLTLLLGLMIVAMHRPLTYYLPHYAATCTYLHSAIFGVASPINPVTWSLEVEAQFYIAMPLLSWVFAIRSKRWRRMLIFSGIIVFAACSRSFPRTALPAQFAYFLVGFLLADIWLGEWREKLAPRPGRDWLAVSAAMLLGVVLFWHHSIPGSAVMLPLLLLIFCLAALTSSWVARGLRHWIPVTLGGMCYTIYLYHLSVLSAFTRVSGKWITVDAQWEAYLLHFLTATPLVLVISFFLFAAVERPFMAWRPKWSRA